MASTYVAVKEKKELYMLSLTNSISGMYLEAFLSIYKVVKDKNRHRKFLMREYQDAMKGIAQWEVPTKEKEYERFRSRVPKLDSLVAGIMLIQYTLNNVKQAPPSVLEYIYQTYVNIARMLWKEPFLVYDMNVDKVTYQKNLLKIQKIIKTNIASTFDTMMPVDEVIVEEAAVIESESESESEKSASEGEREPEIEEAPQIEEAKSEYEAVQSESESEEEEEAVEIEEEEERGQIEEEETAVQSEEEVDTVLENVKIVNISDTRTKDTFF